MINHIGKPDSVKLKIGCGIYEAQEVKLFKNLLKSGYTFVDVGAHIGYYTDIAANIIEDGRIFAFEPSPENFELLKQNTKSFNGNVKIFNCGVGFKNEKRKLFLNPDNSGDHRAYETEKKERDFIESDFVRLDNFLKGEEVHFLKIDVQGFEVEVLRGAEEIIKNSPDINMLLEYSPSQLKLAKYSPGRLIGMLIDLRFNIYTKNKKGWIYASTEQLILNKAVHLNLFCSRKRHNEIEWENNK